MPIDASFRNLKLTCGLRLLRSVNVSNPLTGISLRLLESGWEDDGFHASLGFLNAVARIAATTRGRILELGTGLTTLLLGVIAEKTGSEIWSFEHSPSFHSRITEYIDRYRLKNVHAVLAGLRDFGDFEWYDAGSISDLPSDFSAVIVDGPPGDTKGGRFGLMPVFHNRLAHDVQIIFDDAERAAEIEVLKAWEKGWGLKSTIHAGTNNKKWARCYFEKSPEDIRN